MTQTEALHAALLADLAALEAARIGVLIVLGAGVALVLLLTGWYLGDELAQTRLARPRSLPSDRHHRPTPVLHLAGSVPRTRTSARAAAFRNICWMAAGMTVICTTGAVLLLSVSRYDRMAGLTIRLDRAAAVAPPARASTADRTTLELANGHLSPSSSIRTIADRRPDGERPGADSNRSGAAGRSAIPGYLR